MFRCLIFCESVLVDVDQSKAIIAKRSSPSSQARMGPRLEISLWFDLQCLTILNIERSHSKPQSFCLSAANQKSAAASRASKSKQKPVKRNEKGEICNWNAIFAFQFFWSGLIEHSIAHLWPKGKENVSY